jgi:hypothetical protein
MTITVLLGAGASFEAGVPMALSMTPKIMTTIDARYRRLLQFVYSGLVMQLAAETASDYHNDLATIDVETLFNAVDALGNRNGLNVAPFIAAWNPLVEKVESHNEYDPLREINVEKALAKLISGHSNSPQYAARDLLKELRGEFDRAGTKRDFAGLARAMVNALENLLEIPDKVAVRYLEPLVSFHNRQVGGLSIATLNYDVTIEEAAASAGVDIDDGMARWSESGLIFRDGALRLLKLHGSTSWSEDESGDVTYRALPDSGRAKPGLIFGGQNKLRADGPYLELLWEWRQHLSVCDHLIVIGYSFRDAHINAIVDGWWRKDLHKRITIVDPGFPQHGIDGRLQRMYGMSNERLAPVDMRPGFPRNTYPEKAGYAPVQIIRKGAGATLIDLFDRIALWPPTRLHREDIVSDDQL